MVSLLSVLFTIALSLALPALTVPVPQVPSVAGSPATPSVTGIPVTNGNRPTFGELTTPSRRGTFDDFLASPGPAAPKTIVKGQLPSSAQAQPTKPPAVLPRFEFLPNLETLQF
ncbi:hypothetical protein JB92DRAFT_3141224 [Gautieria morchelliformis]|nr:hypothetical protein JB92DRAFT_3141224 [Gautieria morchelliformis]